MKIPRSFTLITIISLALSTGSTSNVAGKVGRQQGQESQKGQQSQKGLLDPNKASEKELLALPQLNATIVKGILERRPFKSMTDLNAFLSQSLKKEQLGELYKKMFIPINLNTASKEEILMIPGVGNRMLHEFMEYRPYKSMDQFRREIGKYVSKEEVARLERYVTLN
jgi:DNA uptake protein ComE-like DNA-binding protein